MGNILASWINSVWMFADARLSAHEASGDEDHSSLFHPDRHGPFDVSSDMNLDLQRQPTDARADPPSPVALTGQPAFVATDIPSIETPAPPLPRVQSGASSSLFSPTIGVADSRQQHLLVSSVYNESRRPVPMAEDSYSPVPGSDGHPAPSGSPPRPSSPRLRIDIAVANDPTTDHEMIDASFVTAAEVPDASADLCFDDEGLSALERIYLFARSAASFHRVFISRSLPSFLPDVPPGEAVEYVIPLMNGLAMDEDEAVKEALVEDLVSSIWWFLTHCQLVDHEVPEGAEQREVPLLNVQSFTPLLGTLLLNPGANINAPARHCVVNLLTRIREVDSGDVDHFGQKERKLFEEELIQHVVIGMAHLDNDSPPEEMDGSNVVQHETATEHSDTSNELMSPPPSAADDQVLLSTLTSSVHALATSRFLAEEEATASAIASLGASIQRPPSPIPTMHPSVPVSEYEPEFAHIISRQAADDLPDSELGLDPSSPMHGITCLPSWATEPMQNLQDDISSLEERITVDVLQPQIEIVNSDDVSEPNNPTLSRVTTQLGIDAPDAGDDFNEEHAGIGKLASMSLVAAVTASGPLDQRFHTSFVNEVERAGHDSVYWVRREATFALGALAKVVPEELLHISLMPLFDYFCEDSTWNVRQSVLFALPAILSRLPPDSRRMRALQTIQKLSIDPLPQVRTGVLEVLGEVIYSFHEDDKGPPDEIVRLFIGEEGRDWHAPDSPALRMTGKPEPRNPWTNSTVRSRFPSITNNVSGFPVQEGSLVPAANNMPPESDPARSLICAFNFPAVALTLGARRWHELRGLYLFLAYTGTSKVRQTLAASIGEIAKIIGPENTRRDLIYCWWDFARGRESPVRTKAIEALEVFLQVMDNSDRAKLAGSLEEVWDNHLTGWREREIFARSLDRLAPLFPDDGKALGSLLRRALRDATAAVRNAAIEAYPHIYACEMLRPDNLKLVTEEVFSLVNDDSFKKRLTYVECARALVMSNDNYNHFMDESFWHSLVFLASDKIADVRIALARLLSIVCDKILERQRTLPGSILNIVRTLSEDSVADVRAFVLHIIPPDPRPPSELASGVSEGSHSMATFSRPPPRRERKTLVAGLKDMVISGVVCDQEYRQQLMDQGTG